MSSLNSSFNHASMGGANAPSPNERTSAEVTPVGLSVVTIYYLRKLLQQLRTIGNAGLSTYMLHHNDSNLNAILRQIYQEETEIAAVVLQLENLVYYHSMLRHEEVNAPDHIQQLKQLEQKILQCFDIQHGVPGVEF